MKNNLTSYLVGLLFGAGLILSGMTNPEKVQSFLDITGLWDPSLALVMGGAIAVAVIAFTLAGKRQHALIDQQPMRLPTRRDIDRPLIVGALLFGAGWGLAGFCPGPALTALFTGEIKAALFVAAMLGGMQLYPLLKPSEH